MAVVVVFTKELYDIAVSMDVNSNGWSKLETTFSERCSTPTAIGGAMLSHLSNINPCARRVHENVRMSGGFRFKTLEWGGDEELRHVREQWRTYLGNCTQWFPKRWSPHY